MEIALQCGFYFALPFPVDSERSSKRIYEVIEQSTLRSSATEPPTAHPSDPLRTVFDEQTLRRWLSLNKRNVALGRRIDVLTAHGPYPTEPGQRARLRRLRAQRAAWEAYIDAAFACGMFSNTEGNSLCAKLRGKDDESFRAAMAECMACWYLAGKLGLNVSPNPSGRKNCALDFHIWTADEDVLAEVKAPYRERPEDGWWGDDADILAQRLADANKQFEEGQRNLLILAPKLKSEVFASRKQLTNALFGHWVLEVPVDVRAPDAAQHVRHKFVQDGKLFARHRKDGQPLKPDGGPANTRISAVLCIEERYVESVTHPAERLMQIILSKQDGGGLNSHEQQELDELETKYADSLNHGWIEHAALFIHNPNATNPITDEVWNTIPHLVDVGGRLHWSDMLTAGDEP